MRRAADLGVRLEDADAEAVLGEEGGAGEAPEARADDDDVER